jgi:hypothetical protein
VGTTRAKVALPNKNTIVEENTRVKWLRSGFVVGFLVVASTTVATCDSRTPQRQKSSELALIGLWESEQFDTQLGPTTETFCFRADASVSVISRSAGGVLENNGSYVVMDGPHSTIVFTWASGASARAEMIVDPPSKGLFLKSAPRKGRKYRKLSGNC